MPDTFFRNERRGRMHNVLVPNLYVRIFADGMVLFSIRVSLTLSCPMNLKLYPLDRQTCPMQIASCKLRLKNLRFKRKGIFQMVGLQTILFSCGKAKTQFRLERGSLCQDLSLKNTPVITAMSKLQQVR